MFNIDPYLKKIEEICVKYKAKRLALFGSALTSEFNDESDLDFLIELQGVEKGLKRYMKIKNELQTLFRREVDLVMPKSIKNELLEKYIFERLKDCYEA